MPLVTASPGVRSLHEASPFHIVSGIFLFTVIPSEARNLFFVQGRSMNLSDWRRRIDEIDKKLVELLNARSQCALEIGKLKQAAKIPLYQPDRKPKCLRTRRATILAR